MANSSEDSTPRSQQIEQWFQEARNGSAEALGRLLEACRPYLLLVANQQLQPDVQRKVGPSDLVQETFLKAQQHFERFQGGTEEELLAWLRRILFNDLLNTVRAYAGTNKRQVGREIGLAAEESAADVLANRVVDPAPSPGSELIAREEASEVRQALEQLAEDHRQVILWRNWERLSFEDIGQRLGRSAEAARKLWTRAVDELAKTLESSHGSG
ncbi:MAG TPA: sigma-70 family RNA polymerase sigma factor [Gemmataceae bacterium]